VLDLSCCEIPCTTVGTTLASLPLLTDLAFSWATPHIGDLDPPPLHLGHAFRPYIAAGHSRLSCLDLTGRRIAPEATHVLLDLFACLPELSCAHLSATLHRGSLSLASWTGPFSGLSFSWLIHIHDLDLSRNPSLGLPTLKLLACAYRAQAAPAAITRLALAGIFPDGELCVGHLEAQEDAGAALGALLRRMPWLVSLDLGDNSLGFEALVHFAPSIGRMPDLAVLALAVRQPRRTLAILECCC
jgi:hypothetical protein